MNLTKVWHPYWEWDDYKAGMWRSVSGKERKAFLKKAYEFTSNADKYGEAMMKVIQVWKIGCEHHLTNTNSNRRAWIGHAACCFAINCPEDVTRQAWGYLTQDEQDRANAKADLAIATWERMYVGKNKPLH